MAPRASHRAVVLRTHRVTPGMVRLVLGGPDLGTFEAGEFTDHYVKFKLPDPDGGPLRTRTYTVSRWDRERHELTVDFVVHGDGGIAGRWAAAARAGDELDLTGPGGAYVPDPAADWHLMAGDASVIPAIAASLRRVGTRTPVHVVVEVDGPQEEQPLETPGDLKLTWVHRTRPPGEEPELLADAVRALALPPGSGRAFVHGEASSVRALRWHLFVERGMAPADVSVSGYWKLRRTEEGWRDEKAQWNALVEADARAADAAPAS